ncbi:MAG: hypothetical protein V4671_23745 [Armatimonadota bacterium]
MAIALSPEVEQKIREEAARQKKTPDQVTQEVMLEGLRSWRKPESLDELKPREPLPPGKTLKEFRVELGPWPGEETDEELLAALKSMDE